MREVKKMLKTPMEKVVKELLLNGVYLNHNVNLNDFELNYKINSEPIKLPAKLDNETTITFESVKYNGPAMNNLKNSISELEKSMANEMMKELENMLKQFIQNTAEELNVSFKCATYYVKKYFDLNYTLNMDDEECLVVELIPTWKSPENILEDLGEIKDDVECERELLYRDVK